MKSVLLLWYMFEFARSFPWFTVNEPRLRKFNAESVTECFDQLTTSQSSSRPLHFVFIGDSRMRQQFYSFLEFLPDPDIEKIGTSFRSYWAQHAFNVKSHLLNVRVTFFWNHVITTGLTDLFKSWIESNDVPTAIFIGISAHHMTKPNGASQALFEEKLKSLLPQLRSLASVSQVTWFHQVPVIELFAEIEDANTYVHSTKIRHYNRATRRILKDSGVEVFDFFGSLADEYIRSCKVNPERGDNTWFYNCDDYIHTGYLVVHYSTQILLNRLCNQM